MSKNDSEKAAQLWEALYSAFLHLHEERMSRVAALGTTPGELKALMRLVPGEQVTSGELARLWGNDPSTTTWLVDRLEKRGLVERRPDERDRRLKQVALTPAGEVVRRDVLAELYRWPHALDALTSQQEQALLQVVALLQGDVREDPSNH